VEGLDPDYLPDNAPHLERLEAVPSSAPAKPDRTLGSISPGPALPHPQLQPQPPARRLRKDPIVSFRFLHTSDWHLGQSFHGQSRHVEHAAFLDWLLGQLKTLAPDEIHSYVESGEPMDKAGAYAIQGKGFFLVESYDGPYSNIVGLPIDLLKDLLKKLNFST